MSRVEDVFKCIVDADMIENWATTTLQTWFGTYLGEMEVQRGEPRHSYPKPRSYVLAEELDKTVADQMPAIVVVSPGLAAAAPMHEGDGEFTAWWNLGVGVVASASTRKDTKRLVRVYCAAIRAIIVQKMSLGGSVALPHASNCRWVDESYDDNFNFTDDMTISAGQVIFEVQVDDVVTAGAGPLSPSDEDHQPGSHWYEADHIYIDVEKVPVDYPGPAKWPLG